MSLYYCTFSASCDIWCSRFFVLYIKEDLVLLSDNYSYYHNLFNCQWLVIGSKFQFLRAKGRKFNDSDWAQRHTNIVWQCSVKCSIASVKQWLIHTNSTEWVRLSCTQWHTLMDSETLSEVSVASPYFLITLSIERALYSTIYYGSYLESKHVLQPTRAMK